MTWFERLSGLDAVFLYVEDATAHMHVGAVAVFEGTAPTYRELLRHIGSRLHRLPRYRQRLAFVPFELGRPVWVDEPDLDLEHHVRRVALPSPAGDEELKALAGRLFAERLDRQRPLWELWLVEALQPGRFALVFKTHHCMIDGVSGVDLTTALFDREPDPPALPAPVPWKPRPAPASSVLAASALSDDLRRPLGLVRRLVDGDGGSRAALAELGAGLLPLAGLGLMGRAPPSSLNRPLGPRRRWATATLDLAEVKAVKSALGGTVNDVVLAVVAGALRTFFVARGEEPPAELRALVPVSVRGDTEKGTLGNRVSAIFCRLPVGEPEPRARLDRVMKETRHLKGSGQALGALAWTRLGNLAPPALLAAVARYQAVHRYMNLVVTNVPGPREPLYLLGREMVAFHPLVPLAPGQTVGIALESYAGRLGFGLVADADRVPDLRGAGERHPPGARRALGARLLARAGEELAPCPSPSCPATACTSPWWAPTPPRRSSW